MCNRITDHERHPDLSTGTCCPRSGCTPAERVVFPDRIRAPGAAGSAPYQPLIDRLAGRGETVVDLQTAFDRYGEGRDLAEFSVGPWGHYAPPAHALVARHLEDVLRREGLATLAEVEKHQRR